MALINPFARWIWSERIFPAVSSAFSRIFAWIKVAFRQARDDWNAAGSLRIISSMIIPVWIVFLILLFKLLFILFDDVFRKDGMSACQPDGSFNMHSNSYNQWSTSSVFEITLSFGELSFGQAKLIDVAWDVVRCSEPRIFDEF